MGGIWLTGMYDWLSDAGLDVDVYDSAWTTRSRSSGGYDDVRGIGIHHDASSVNSSEQSSCDWGWKNSSDRPIGALRLGRNGHITVGAAGATNTMGKGGPLSTSRGQIPKDQGNLYMVAIEAANTGVGEPWPQVQIDAYLVMVKTLITHLGLRSSDVYSHAGYCQPSCPGRKIDPAGPTPSHPDLGGTSGCVTWKDANFRKYLDGTGLPPDPIPPTGEVAVNWNPSSGTVNGVQDAPPVSETLANQYNDWAMIAFIKAIQKVAGLSVTGKYDQRTAEYVDSKL